MLAQKIPAVGIAPGAAARHRKITSFHGDHGRGGQVKGRA